jgi:hypothetical protein
VALWHHHQCPPLLKNPLETFVLLSREHPSLHTISVTVAWQCLPPCGLQCLGHAHSMHLKKLVFPLYSLDLALFDFRVFSLLRKALKLL